MAVTTSPGSSTLVSRRDLRFLLHEWLEVERLADRERFAGQTAHVYDEVLALAERIATDLFAPHNRKADANEPHIGEDGRVVLVPEVGPAVRAFNEAGMAGCAMDESVGGMQLPQVVASAALAFFIAANVGTATYLFLTMAAANTLQAVGSAEQIDRWVPPMVEGRFFGTMCLSETQAGSSLSDIATRAVPQDDGTYRLFGTKMWISGAEHELAENIVHLVLARVPGGQVGIRGISLFLVPRYLLDADGARGDHNDVVLAGLNHKMGVRGVVNTVLGFGEGVHRPRGAPGAIGYLIGEEGRGLAAMFNMMNEARIGTGLGAASLGYTGFLKAVRYARERLQGRPVLAKNPATPQVPIIEHADVKRMLLAQKSYVEGALALILYCAHLVDDERTLEDAAARQRAHLLLEVLTPIAKAWPSQWCLEANSLAIQVHGGYGYTRDYDVEQHYRDNRINPIHEGTNGIQALDFLGRKVTMENGAGLTVLAETIGATLSRARDAGDEPAELARQLDCALQRLLDVTRQAWSSGQPDAVLANATPYLEAAGHIAIAWMWLEQFLAADGKHGAFYDGKRQAARYFFRTELPKVGSRLALVAMLDRTSLDTQPDWL